MDITVTFTLKTTIQFLPKTLQLIMMHHNIKCGCKKISSSVNVVEKVIFDYVSPHCDLELEDSKPIFLQDTLAHGDPSSYQVWLQKVQQLGRYRPDKHQLEF